MLVGANMPPFFHQKSTKIHKKSIPKGIENLIDFRPHFLLIFAPSWDPSWGHVGHFFATRRPQDPPKKHRKLVPALKTGQNASWTRSRAAQTPSGPGLWTPKPRFWTLQSRPDPLRTWILDPKTYRNVPRKVRPAGNLSSDYHEPQNLDFGPDF